MAYNAGDTSMINYRQTGKLAGGRRHTGAVNRGRNTASSIPSKFETVLFHGQKEVRGFNQQSQRFDRRIKQEHVPGPGAYSRNSTFTSKSPESFSRKGYGSFASNAQRFRQPRPTYYPGPGEHDVLRVALPSTVPSHRNVFASTVPRIPVQKQNPELGPGHYSTSSPTRVYVYCSPSMSRAHGDKDAAKLFGEHGMVGPSGSKRHIREMKTLRAAFGGGQVRFPPKKPKDVPSPGAYNPNIQHTNHPAAASAFRSKKERGFQPSSSPKDIMYYRSSRQDESPGPGKYNTNYKPRQGKLSVHSMFIERESDRWGNPKVRKSKKMLPEFYPGPGQYDPEPERNVQVQREAARLQIVLRNKIGSDGRARSPPSRGSPSFKAQGRITDFNFLNSPPGPAYYKHNGKMKASKSYHVNKTRKWV